VWWKHLTDLFDAVTHSSSSYHRLPNPGGKAFFVRPNDRHPMYGLDSAQDTMGVACHPIIRAVMDVVGEAARSRSSGEGADTNGRDRTSMSKLGVGVI